MQQCILRSIYLSDGISLAMCFIEQSKCYYYSKLQRLGKISYAEISLRKAMKELQENSRKLGPAVSLWSGRQSSFIHLSASPSRHSLCWKSHSQGFHTIVPLSL